jgi:hypothetical protein
VCDGIIPEYVKSRKEALVIKRDVDFHRTQGGHWRGGALQMARVDERCLRFSLASKSAPYGHAGIIKVRAINVHERVAGLRSRRWKY